MKDTKKKVQWILNELELHIEAIFRVGRNVGFFVFLYFFYLNENKILQCFYK